MANRNAFLDVVYAAVAFGHPRAAVNHVFNRFNRLLADENFGDANYILAHVRPQRLDLDTALAFMTITFAAKGNLTCRAELYVQIHDRLCELAGHDKADRLLTRLK